LAASVEWSYRLLNHSERRIFRHLSVFPAPFIAAAAQAAAGPDAGRVLSRLVRRSMLGAPRPGLDGQSRYAMLETLRAFGQERLAETGGDQAVRSAVAVWTVSQAEDTATGFHSGATRSGRGPTDGRGVRQPARRNSVGAAPRRRPGLATGSCPQPLVAPAGALGGRPIAAATGGGGRRRPSGGGCRGRREVDCPLLASDTGLPERAQTLGTASTSPTLS
jgi:hypothetical protein